MRYFIAPHLAFLVQWIRILGIDVQIWKKEVVLQPEEEELIQWERTPLPFPGQGIRVITLSASSRAALLKEFLTKVGIQPEIAMMFKRCLLCNGPLQPLNRAEAIEKAPELPEYVLQTQSRFNWCEGCRKIYWAGTHVQNMIRTLQEWDILPPPQKVHS